MVAPKAVDPRLIISSGVVCVVLGVSTRVRVRLSSICARPTHSNSHTCFTCVCVCVCVEAHIDPRVAFQHLYHSSCITSCQLSHNSDIALLVAEQCDAGHVDATQGLTQPALCILKFHFCRSSNRCPPPASVPDRVHLLAGSISLCWSCISHFAGHAHTATLLLFSMRKRMCL